METGNIHTKTQRAIRGRETVGEQEPVETNQDK